MSKNLQFLYSISQTHPTITAIIDANGEMFSYSQLICEINLWKEKLSLKISPSTVVAVYGDFSFKTVSIFFALIELNAIIVPLAIQNKDIEQKIQIAEVDLLIDLSGKEPIFTSFNSSNKNILFDLINKNQHPGIIIFSSGSTGEPKAALHDFTFLLSKFFKPRKPFRSIVFLLFDHWGGINTLLHILSCGGTVCFPAKRDPDSICNLIDQYELDLLPSTPTFLNLILLNQAHKRYRLSSLKMITYGTESMPESTLLRLNEVLPNVQFKQTYGLTELGVMRTESRANNSLWLKVGGEDYQTKIVDEVLYIKTQSSIIGYLNSSSPFDDEGWYCTGDRVAVDGDWICFLGRESDLINVGGQKVFPSEIESTIMSLDWVADCLVYGEKNPITGMHVACNIVINKSIQIPENPVLEIKKWCKSKLESYKIPVRINLVEENKFNERFKKVRPHIIPILKSN
jgi:acyl-coenzyme A synthetase/AMP-(fatty) acid ligase